MSYLTDLETKDLLNSVSTLCVYVFEFCFLCLLADSPLPVQSTGIKLHYVKENSSSVNNILNKDCNVL